MVMAQLQYNEISQKIKLFKLVKDLYRAFDALIHLILYF